MRLFFKRLAAAVLCFVIILTVPLAGQTAASLTPDFESSLVSEGILLCEADSGHVLYEKQADLKQVPASLVKIMTATLALEYCPDLDVPVTANYSALQGLYERNASVIGLRIGEEMPLRDLLYGVMLRSGCDAANVVGEYVGSLPQARQDAAAGENEAALDVFVRLMNQKAQELGAKNTVFVDSHGLDNDTQRSTANDMAIITRHALSLPVFKEIATTSSYTAAATNQYGASRTWYHTNAMTQSGSVYYMKGVTGIKTGTSGVNTRNLVSKKTIDGIDCLVIVLGAPASAADGSTLYGIYEDSRALYQWAADTFQCYSLAEEGQALTKISVAAGAGSGEVAALPETSLTMLLPKGVQVDTTFTTDTLAAPLAEGAIVGNAVFSLNGSVLASVKLVAAENVQRDNLKMILLWFQNNWPLFGFLLLAAADIGGIFLLLRRKGSRSK